MRPAIPADTTSFIVAASEDEAHYLARLLNSATTSNAIASFSASGRGFGSPSVIQRSNLPRFDDTDEVHRRLVVLARQFSITADERLEEELEKVIQQVLRATSVAAS